MVYDFSFDPNDPLFILPDWPGVRWGIQVFTTVNLYGLAPERTRIIPGENRLHLVCDQLSWAGQQQRQAGRVEADLRIEGDVFSWRIQAWHAEPIKSIKLMLWGLPTEALAKGWWHATTARDTALHPTPTSPLRWRYPWPEWQTAWACAGDQQQAVCFSVRDEQVRAKRLYVFMPPYNDMEPIVEVLCDEDARHWDTHFAAPPIHVRRCAEAAHIQADFEAHLAHLEKSFNLLPWEQRTDIPAWIHDIRLVLNLHGQHWTGYVFNTFDQMADRLRFVVQHIPGDSILAYIPGWEGRYYYVYPHYSPGEAMGGAEAFGRLMATARDLGVHVMPMFGANGANVQVFSNWEQAAFRNTTNRYVKLINCPDWDLDRLGEGDQVFLNPGESGYRQHLFDQVSQMVETYDLEGVFLDTSACWFNDPRFSLYEGYQVLLASLRGRFPNLLIAGEGWWDALLGIFPVNQSWLGMERRYRFPQVLTRYARALGHLAEGTPGYGSTGVHERGYFPSVANDPAEGHIPSLGIVDDTFEKDRDEIVRICQMAKDRRVR